MTDATRLAGPGTTRTEVIVYYSGHADEKGLLLGEDRYSYRSLRDRLDQIPADVRIAVLDACASGAFTRIKGGRARSPFLVDESTSMRGHAFLTSSAATEVAQESDRIRASYFTHYLVSGLRGAADLSGEGRVTLNEAYQFAFSETLGRTVDSKGGAQHPSYDISMSGTGDVVMTDVRQLSATGLDESEWPPDNALLLEEVKVGCMHGLLTCLDRPHRLAYILGEILELDGIESARILSISPAAFRKRLSRAREAIIEFTRVHCGLVDPANACRCVRRLPRAQAMHRVNASALLLADADSARAFPETLEKVRRLELVRRTAALYRSSPQPVPGPELLERIHAALESG